MRKKALITGASRGIGEEIAGMLAGEGYDLVIVCKNSGERLTRLRERLQRECGIRCEAAVCDVSDSGQVEMLFEIIGEVDVLVNNAAVSYVGLLTDMSVEKWREVLDTNLSSLFYTCRAAVPGMVRKKAGKIINISSVWGSAGASMEVAYSASKGGVNSFTKALAKELAPSNIQVNAVACGAIDTEMNQWMEEDELIGLVEDIPTGRLGRAEEVADLVYHLGYKNAYLTGQVIGLDGGWI